MRVCLHEMPVWKGKVCLALVAEGTFFLLCPCLLLTKLCTSFDVLREVLLAFFLGFFFFFLLDLRQIQALTARG